MTVISISIIVNKDKKDDDAVEDNDAITDYRML